MYQKIPFLWTGGHIIENSAFGHSDRYNFRKDFADNIFDLSEQSQLFDGEGQIVPLIDIFVICYKILINNLFDQIVEVSIFLEIYKRRLVN